MMDVRKQKYEASRRRFPASANVIVTAVQERSLGCAFDDDGAKCYQNFAVLPYDYAPHHPFEPSEPIEPSEPVGTGD